MKLYNVTIIRRWDREIEANSEEEAQELAYKNIEDISGDDFDEVDIDLLEDDEEETED